MKVKLLLTMSLLSVLVRLTFASEVEEVPLAPNVSHQAWDALLKKYVTDRGLVGYADWKKNQVDLAALDSYLKLFRRETGDTGQRQRCSGLANQISTTRPLSAGFSPTIHSRASWGSKIRLEQNVMISAAAKHRSMISSTARCGRCSVTARTQYWFAQPGVVRRCNGLPTCHHNSMRKSIAPTAPGSLERI